MHPQVSCVLVHHDNLGELPDTAKGILDQGIDARDLLVVDNSGEKVSELDLRDALPPEVAVERISNRGYGNAVNSGVDRLLEREYPPRYILVVTHEVRPQHGTVSMLLRALETHPDLVAVGPTLHTSPKSGGQSVASGGTATRLLGIPQHVPSVSPTEDAIVERSWLDGAFILYRQEAFGESRFREEFFMYVEETEFHYRLRKEGGRIGCVTSAHVSETANDIPPLLQGRNLQWLLDLHGRPLQRRLAVPSVIAKAAIKALLGRKQWVEVRELWSGWRQARREPIGSLRVK